MVAKNDFENRPIVLGRYLTTEHLQDCNDLSENWMWEPYGEISSAGQLVKPRVSENGTNVRSRRSTAKAFGGATKIAVDGLCGLLDHTSWAANCMELGVRDTNGERVTINANGAPT